MEKVSGAHSHRMLPWLDLLHTLRTLLSVKELSHSAPCATNTCHQLCFFELTEVIVSQGMNFEIVKVHTHELSYDQAKDKKLAGFSVLLSSMVLRFCKHYGRSQWEVDNMHCCRRVCSFVLFRPWKVRITILWLKKQTALPSSLVLRTQAGLWVAPRWNATDLHTTWISPTCTGSSKVFVFHKHQANQSRSCELN